MATPHPLTNHTLPLIFRNSKSPRRAKSTAPFFTLLLLASIQLAHAAPPAAPVIIEPSRDGAVASPFDVHMAIEERFSGADGHTLASTDWEIRRASDRALQWSAYGISDLRIWHVHFGDGNFAAAGRTALDPATNHILRARTRDSDGEASAWTERPFATGRLEEIFPLLLTDILPSPAVSWVDPVSSGQILLPPSAQPHEFRLESCCGHLFHRLRGPAGNNTPAQMENPAAVPQDKPLRAIFQAGGANLSLPASRVSFVDGRGAQRNVHLPPVNLPAGQQLVFWISIAGSSFEDESGTNVPTFGKLAQGAPVSWVAAQPGYIIEVVSTGYQLPTAVCFVPQPSAEPAAPKFYVAELYGKIKVVANNGAVSDFATGLLNYTPDPLFPGSGEMGIADIAVHPQTGDLFVSLVERRSGNFYGTVQRLRTTDGGRTVAGTPETIFSTFPFRTLQSHQISNIAFDGAGRLLVHVGDGFEASSALNLSDPRGKILRMSVDGNATASNPFYNAAAPRQPSSLVFSYGYRNPFGGDWRSSDQALYVVENGTDGNDRLSRATAGQSYGWNGSDSSLVTGAIHNWANSVAPVQLAFVQPSVFSGSGFPAAAQDRAYVTESGPTYAAGPQAFGKKITSFDLGPTGQKISGPDILASYQGTGRSTAAAIAAGPDGLYFSDLYPESGNNPAAPGANILRIRFAGAADFSLQNNTGAPPLQVSFADTSTVPAASAWLWEFGDGTTSTERNPVHTYTQAGTYQVRLTVTGPGGASIAIKPGAVVVDDRKHVLMVVGATSLNPSEESIRQRLLAKNHLVTHVADSASSSADAANKSLVIVSSTVLSGNVSSKFRDTPVPVLCYESHLFDDFGMSGPVSGTDYGTRWDQTQIQILADPGDPLVRGLPAGMQSATATPAIFTWGRPHTGAKVSALLQTGGEAAIFRFEAGAPLAGGISAPARRIALMLEDQTAQALTQTGWALVERAIDWAANLPPQVELEAPAAGATVRTSDTVSISAKPTDRDGEIVRVDFSANGAAIGAAESPPHTLQWTPPAPGTYDLRAQAFDDQGSSFLGEAVRIEAVSPFEFWRRQYFAAPQLANPLLSGPRADPDLDGMPNLLEYASGSSPLEHEPNLPHTAMVETPEGAFPSITYKVSSYAAVDVAPELSTGLSGPWTGGADHFETEVLLTGDGYTEFRTRAKKRLPELGGRAFFRLRATAAHSP